MIQTYKATIKHEVEHGYLLQEEDVVLYADHEAEIAALKESRDDWKRQWRYMEAGLKMAEERIKELEAALEEKP
jgi:hypothetical protein